MLHTYFYGFDGYQESILDDIHNEIAKLFDTEKLDGMEIEVKVKAHNKF